MPAAAVIRRVQALSGFTGFKGSRRVFKSVVKSYSLTVELPLILLILNIVEVGGIHHVAVKCLDMM